MNGNYLQHAQIIRLKGFKIQLNALKEEHNKIQEKFNILCDKLDNRINSNDVHVINEICSHLTVYSADLDLLSTHIKEITKIIEDLLSEISN